MPLKLRAFFSGIGAWVWKSVSTSSPSVCAAGAAEVAPTVRNNTFTDLQYGLLIDAAPQPVVEGNVFENCLEDISRL